MIDQLRVNDKIVGFLMDTLRSAKTIDEVPKMIMSVIKLNAWRERKSERLGGIRITFKTFDEFITTQTPEGLGTTVDRMTQIVANTEAEIPLRIVLAETDGDYSSHGGDRKSKEYQDSDTTLISTIQKDNRYIMRRLRRDQPEHTHCTRQTGGCCHLLKSDTLPDHPENDTLV